LAVFFFAALRLAGFRLAALFLVALFRKAMEITSPSPLRKMSSATHQRRYSALGNEGQAISYSHPSAAVLGPWAIGRTVPRKDIQILLGSTTPRYVPRPVCGLHTNQVVWRSGRSYRAIHKSAILLFLVKKFPNRESPVVGPGQ
jgi:hypothetical protein